MLELLTPFQLGLLPDMIALRLRQAIYDQVNSIHISLDNPRVLQT